MFINTVKFNKHIYYKKEASLFFNKKKNSPLIQIFKGFDIKPTGNFLHIHKNKNAKFYQHKNIIFDKKNRDNLWWFFGVYRNFNLAFVPNLFYLMKLTIIYNSNFKKILYKTSKGNSIIFWHSNFLKNRNVFRLPSKKKLILPFFVFSLLNRKEGFYSRKSRLRFFKYKKKKTVRGIAQNPVDHHNGGSSKTKKPLFNKYYKIAKNSK